MRKWKIRYALLEYLVYWEDDLTASRLGKLLGKSREHVQREVITPYRKEFADSFASRGGRRDNPDTQGPPRFAPATPGALIDLVRGEARLAEAAGESPRFGISVEDVACVAFQETHTEIFRSLYRACVQRRSVLVEYASKRRISVIWFSPHALVRDFARMHFRGYASWSENQPGYFIDLVPSRVCRVLGDGNSSSYVSGDSDMEWNERVTLRFRMNPKLPENIRKVLRLEHEEDRTRQSFDTLEIRNVRRAIRRYVERSLSQRYFGESLHQVWLPDHEKDSGANSVSDYMRERE